MLAYLFVGGAIARFSNTNRYDDRENLSPDYVLLALFWPVVGLIFALIGIVVLAGKIVMAVAGVGDSAATKSSEVMDEYKEYRKKQAEMTEYEYATRKPVKEGKS